MKKNYFFLLVAALILFSVGEIFAQPLPPVLVYPTNGGTNIPLYPTFQWNASTGATSYHIQVFQGVTVVIDVSGITTTQYAVVSAVLTNNTTYTWRVNATGPTGTSAWSSTWSFTTVAAGPGIPNLTQPPNDTTNVSLTPYMEWESVTGATTYQIQISTSSSFTPLIVDVSGLTSNSYVVPSGYLTNNTGYYWHVQAFNGTIPGGYQTSPWHFTTIPGVPPAPQPTAPSNGATGVTIPVTLQWNSVSGASSYGVQVSLNSSFTSVVLDQGGITTTSYTIPTGILSGSTQYYWHVNATNVAGTGPYSTPPWSFTTAASPPAAPLLVSPPDSSLVLTLTPQLVWQAVSGTGITYRVQVSANYNFTPLIVNVGGLTATNYTVPAAAGLQYNTTYHWRVQATNSVGTGPWSSIFRFVTLLQAPPAPTLLTPTNHSGGVSLTPLFTWSNVSQAAQYRIQVSPTNTFTNLIINALVTTPSFQAPSGALIGNTTYYWRVASINSQGTQGNWSTPTWDFTTMQTMNLNLKVLLEGFYNGTSMVQDTIRVYLAQSASPYTLKDSCAVFLDANGNGVLSFSKAPNGNYWLSIKHRNHLETWSSSTLAFSTGNTVQYDFTTSSSKAYCNNMKQVGSVWVLWGGDCFNDGSVNAFDYNLFKTQFGLDGYNNCDLNGDGFVDGYDVLILYANLGKGYCRPQ